MLFSVADTGERGRPMTATAESTGPPNLTLTVTFGPRTLLIRLATAAIRSYPTATSGQPLYTFMSFHQRS
jgi:hypothetical protein